MDKKMLYVIILAIAIIVGIIGSFSYSIYTENIVNSNMIKAHELGLNITDLQGVINADIKSLNMRQTMIDTADYINLLNERKNYLETASNYASGDKKQLIDLELQNNNLDLQRMTLARTETSNILANSSYYSNNEIQSNNNQINGIKSQAQQVSNKQQDILDNNPQLKTYTKNNWHWNV